VIATTVNRGGIATVVEDLAILQGIVEIRI